MRCRVAKGIDGEFFRAKQIVLGCTPQACATSRWVIGVETDMNSLGAREAVPYPTLTAHKMGSLGEDMCFLVLNDAHGG